MAIHVWRFLSNTANFPGWNVAVDQAGAAVLLDGVARASATGAVPEVSFELVAPTTRVLDCVNNAGAAVVSASRLRFEWDEDPGHISVQEADGAAIIRLGDASLTRLRDALTAPETWFDRSLAPDASAEGEVWFWGVFGVCPP